MSKAVEGAALLGGAAGIFGLMALFPGSAFLAAPLMWHVMGALALSGVSMEAGAIASALTANRGAGITTRQAAAYRQIILGGDTRCGGISIFESTTGAENDQYNYVVVFSGHEIDSFVTLYLDGRQVYWQGSGPGYAVRNGYGFGGIANSSTYTGPDGNQYNFGGTGHSGIYVEARCGDQLPGDVMGSLTANDPNWAADGHGNSPWVAGCAYLYIKIEYNPTVFPNPPEIKVAVRGKNNIWDPRTETTGFSNNSALLAADVIRDTQFGLGDVEAFQDSGSLAQLIAAANICDEQVLVQALSSVTDTYESQYCASHKYDASAPPGDVIDVLLATCGGRISMPGGEWYIFPATWVGPSFTFDLNALAGPISWKPTRKQDKLYNRVLGTYTAPGFPWNILGNLYNKDGFYNGGIQNNFAFADQPTDYPPYAADPLHGYAADEYLEADSKLIGAWSNIVTYGLGDVISTGAGTSLVMFKSLVAANLGNNPATCSFPNGAAAAYNSGTTYAQGQAVASGGLFYVSLVNSNTGNTPSSSPSDWALCAWVPYANLLPMQLILPGVQSVTQAQRLAKIALLRNRAQGSGDLPCMQTVFQMQCCDVMEMTFAAMGWTEKYLEAVSATSSFSLLDGDDDGEQTLRDDFQLGVIETSPDIYAWDPATEELTVYDVAASPTQQNRTVAPPTGMSLTSGLATAVIGLDGVVQPRIEVQWTTPADALTTQIQIQYQTQGGTAGPWVNAGYVDAALNLGYIPGVVAGIEYGVRIRSVRSASGATSVWVEEDAYTVSTSLSVLSQQLALAQSSLTSAALSGGTADIYGVPFSAAYGNEAVSVAPSNYPLAGLNQGQLYEVYYVDTAYAGGAVTAIATQNPADYLSKPGYFLIGTIVTPVYGGGTSPGPWYPSAYADLQSGANQATQNPAAVYGPSTTPAVVSGAWVLPSLDQSDCIIYSGFPAVTTSGSCNLQIARNNLYAPANSGGSWLAEASLDGGSTWSTIESVAAPGSGITGVVNYAIPSGTALADLQVRLTAAPVASGAGPNTIAIALDYIFVYQVAFGPHPEFL